MVRYVLTFISWVQDPGRLHNQHRGEEQRQLPVSRGDAAASPLRDALHPILPHRLLLGLHTQEEWDRAGLQVCGYRYT